MTEPSSVDEHPDVKDRDPLDPSPYAFERMYRGHRYGFVELEARQYLRIRKLSTEKRTIQDPDTMLDREVEFYNRETEERLLRNQCVVELDPETGKKIASGDAIDYDGLPLRVYSAINRDISILLYDPEENELAKQQDKQEREAEERGTPLGNG